MIINHFRKLNCLSSQDKYLLGPQKLFLASINKILKKINKDIIIAGLTITAAMFFLSKEI